METNIARRLFWILTYCIVQAASISCSVANKSSRAAGAIKSFKLIQTFPNLDFKRPVLEYDTSIAYLHFFGGKVLYNSSYGVYSKNVDSPEYRRVYRNVVLENGSANANLSDERMNIWNQKVPRDSILQDDWVTRFDFYHLFTQDKTELIKEERLKGDKGFIKLYKFQGATDTSLRGTIELKFAGKYTGDGFSLSRDLDSINNSKLYEVNIINNARSYQNFQLPSMNQNWYLSEIPVPDTARIMSFFNLVAKPDSVKN